MNDLQRFKEWAFYHAPDNFYQQLLSLAECSGITSDWQPIETAPHYPTKNRWDQPVILAVFGERACKCQYDPDNMGRKSPRPFWHAPEIGVAISREEQPKLWMPMPDVPVELL